MESCGGCDGQRSGVAAVCFAEGRVAGCCSTSAVPAIGGRPTAGRGADRKHNGNNGGTPTGDTSKVWKDGSITVTGNGPTGTGAASGA